MYPDGSFKEKKELGGDGVLPSEQLASPAVTLPVSSMASKEEQEGAVAVQDDPNDDADDAESLAPSEHDYGPHGGPLEREETAATIHEGTTTATAVAVLQTIRSRKPVPPFSHPLATETTTADCVVQFDGPDDPYHPRNWTNRKKIITTFLYGMTTMGATFHSSVYTPAIGSIMHRFNVSQEVGNLGLALILFGFGIGPMLWAPLSEVYGRKSAVLLPYFIAAMFALGSACAMDIQTLMICRFFAGFFSSAPITNTGGVLGDIWGPEERAAAMVGYAMAVIIGPVFGPIVGGAIIVRGVSWRWCEYVAVILMLVTLAADMLFLDESYPPVLLVKKAQTLRFETGNWALHAKHEEWKVSFKELSRRYLVRPFQLLATPICFLMAAYASFVYGILYGNLSAFPIVFEEIRGWNILVAALPFIAVIIGVVIGAVINIANNKYYMKTLKKNKGRPVPEARLPPMMVGSVFFAAGMFLFAWTVEPKFHWIIPMIGAVFTGIGFFTIFQACLNYLIDTFTTYGASAIAANTFLRSAVGGAFPLFMTTLLRNVGVPWGLSIFGFISIAMIPIPFLFFIYGKRIRARGSWSKASVA